MTDKPMTPPTLPFKFSGKGGEYFKIWIVNFILSVLTLGIYSAWAKVRTNRYMYGNTSLENSAFEYHATPIQILKGRIIAIIALVLYVLLSNTFPIAGLVFAGILAVLTPWAIWRSMQFNARMISYRNVRFSFHGMLKEAYKILLLIPLLPLIIGAILAGIIHLTLGEVAPVVVTGVIGIAFLATYLIFPYVQKLVTVYYINNQQYGQGKFSTQLSTKKYYAIYLALLGWIILFMIGISMLVGVIGGALGLFGSFADLGAIKEGGDTEAMKFILSLIGLFYIPFIVISLWGKAYLEKNIRNYVLNNTELDDVVQLNSEIKTGRLFSLYLTNTLLVLVTFGLAYPWAKIRMHKYKIETSSATIKGNIAQYINQQQEKQSALGEELGMLLIWIWA